jgi:hypothetical protein
VALTRQERETVISFNSSGMFAHIYTSRRTDITRLKRNPAARLLEEGSFEGSPWAVFEIDRRLVSFRSGRATRALSEEERRARSERMRAVRAKASARSKT